MGEERLALRGWPLSFLIIPFEAHLSGCGAGPGGPPTSWCPPFSGANAAEAQHHNPTQPRLLRIFPLFFLPFFLSIHPPLPPLFFSFIRLLLPLSSFASFPLCFFIPPTLPPLPSIDSRPLATLSSAILCPQLLCFSRSRPSHGTRKESESAGHPRNTSITIFYKSLMCAVVTTAARRAFGELPAAASCSRRAA